MIQLSEDDIGGPLSGRPPDYEEDARRRALEALSRPLDLGPVASEGEAAQALGDARRATMPEPTRAGDMGIRPEDAIPPSQGGPSELAPEPAPVASAQPRPVVQLTEEDVGGPIVAPARPMAPAAQPASMSAAPMPAEAASAPLEAQGQPKDASRPRDPMQAEIDASRDAQRRRILAAAFGNIIRGIGGVATGTVVPLQDMPDVGQASEEEAAIRARHRTAAAQKAREDREAEQSTARQEREDAQRAEEMAFRREQLEVQRTRGTGGAPASPLQQAQADRIREEMALRAREQDPASRESEIARGQFLGLVDAQEPSRRARFAQAIPQDRLATMSAAELRPLISTISVHRERGTAGGGGGGNPAARAARAQTREQLVTAYMGRTGASREEATAAVGALGDTRAAAALTTDALARGRSEAAAEEAPEEILPGVQAGLTLSPGEGRAARDRLMTYRDGYRALNAIDELSRRYGAGAMANPALLAEIEPQLVTLRAMVAQIQGTGIINPGERPLIDATLPDLGSFSGWTLGRIAGAMRGWRARLDGASSSLLESRGVSPDGITAGLHFLHTGATRRREAPGAPAGGAAPEGGQAAPAVERVPMLDPDGRRMMVRADQREAAIGRGWRAAQ